MIKFSKLGIKFIFGLFAMLLSLTVLAKDEELINKLKAEFSSKGSCKSQQRDVDLENIFFLKNTVIKLSNKEGYRVAEIQGEGIRISNFKDSDRVKTTSNVNLEIEINKHNKNEENLDLNPEFIILDGEVAVFWKETYQHQRYKQGIFKLEGNDLIWLCEGTGGTYKSH